MIQNISGWYFQVFDHLETTVMLYSTQMCHRHEMIKSKRKNNIIYNQNNVLVQIHLRPKTVHLEYSIAQ